MNVLQLGTVHLCRSVIRSIETARIFDFEEFPKRDKVRVGFIHIYMYLYAYIFYIIYLYDVFQVTYMYYTGRLEVFNENFPAVSDLNFFKNNVSCLCS